MNAITRTLGQLATTPYQQQAGRGAVSWCAHMHMSHIVAGTSLAVTPVIIVIYFVLVQRHGI